jgi:hypothetical protein
MVFKAIAAGMADYIEIHGLDQVLPYLIQYYVDCMGCYYMVSDNDVDNLHDVDLITRICLTVSISTSFKLFC